MRTVARREITDWQTYEDARDAIRREVMREKERRRVHVGDHLTFLFENALTMRYQVQEMVRAERIVRERDIEHELATYNALLGGPGELAATLLIEIDDPETRARLLREWKDLPRHVYVEVEGGARVPARFDEGQVGEEKLSSVQYLKFDVGGRVPVAVGCDLAPIAARTVLDADRRAALEADLRDG